MEQQSDWSQSSKQTLNRALKKVQSMRDEDSNVVVVKENSKICGCQAFLYLTILYLLAVAVFYLMISLTKPTPLECSLNCNFSQQSCSCQLGRVAWAGPTVVELAWFSANMLSKMNFEEEVVGVSIIDRNQSQQLTLDPELQSTCFPSGCQAMLGIVPSQISEGNLLTIFFKTIPFTSQGNLTATFREYSEAYPQLSTRRQLAINFIFAIVVGIFAFTRKHIFLEHSIKEKEVMKDEEIKEEHISVSEEIEELDRQLAVKYSAALEIYRKIIEQSGQLDYDSDDDMQVYE